MGERGQTAEFMSEMLGAGCLREQISRSLSGATVLRPLLILCLFRGAVANLCWHGYVNLYTRSVVVSSRHEHPKPQRLELQIVQHLSVNLLLNSKLSHLSVPQMANETFSVKHCIGPVTTPNMKRLWTDIVKNVSDKWCALLVNTVL